MIVTMQLVARSSASRGTARRGAVGRAAASDLRGKQETHVKETYSGTFLG